jgi:DNA ligase (NAD+)
VTAVALTQPLEPKEPPVKSEADLFTLTIDELLPIKSRVVDADTGVAKLDSDGKEKVVEYFRKKDGTAATVATKLLEELEKAKSQPAWRVLVSLSIRHVGPVAARSLMNSFGSIEEIFDASEEKLAEVDGVGQVVAKTIKEWIAVDWHKDIVLAWKKAGVNFTQELAQGGSGVFSGMSIVVTGTLDSLTRDQAEEAIIAAGGKAASSVSKNTAFVLAGASAGSKLAKAESLGVEVISEAEFLKRLKAN